MRRQALSRSLLRKALALLLVLLVVWGAPMAVQAAEVLQVSAPDQLLIGDRNRSAPVLLGCMVVEVGLEAEAQSWLRQHLPRHSRVNLRPLGERQGLLVARVSSLDPNGVGDIAAGLVAAGLAKPLPCL